MFALKISYKIVALFTENYPSLSLGMCQISELHNKDLIKTMRGKVKWNKEMKILTLWIGAQLF